MKTCPACGTQYEDHVPQCFVDGSSLDDVATSVPAPVALEVHSPKVEGEAEGFGRRLLLLPLLLLFFLFGMGAMVAFTVGMRTTGVVEAPVPEPTIEPAEPVPPPAPAPVPPPAPIVTMVGITSTPEGAVVFEGEASLCTTPCSIEHPEHAPLPRQLVLKLGKHENTPYVLEAADRPHHVTLKEIRVVRPTPRPSAGPSPRPRPPTPQPRPQPRPKPSDIQLER